MGGSVSLKFVKTLGLIPNSKKQKQKAKAQHSMLIANLNRQGCREAKLNVIFVGAMDTIYKDYTDKHLADLNRLPKIKKLKHKLNEHSIRHAFALIKTRYALQYNTSNNSQGLGLVATAHNPLTNINFLFLICAMGGCLVRAPK